jgi:hypothetical protein
VVRMRQRYSGVRVGVLAVYGARRAAVCRPRSRRCPASSRRAQPHRSSVFAGGPGLRCLLGDLDSEAVGYEQRCSAFRNAASSSTTRIGTA